MLTTLRVLKRQILINTKNVTFLNMAGLSQGPQPITSARSTVIAAEVAVKVMYYEEPELLPTADVEC